MTPRMGLPASYIKKYGVSKRAWREYRKKHPKTHKSSRSRTTGKVKRVARKRRRRRRYFRRIRRRRPRTIPIVAVVPPLAVLGVEVKTALDSGWGWEGALSAVTESIAGYNIQNKQLIFDRRFKTFWTATIVGAVAHKAANMLGVNRHFANLPAPLNKLRL